MRTDEELTEVWNRSRDLAHALRSAYDLGRADAEGSVRDALADEKAEHEKTRAALAHAERRIANVCAHARERSSYDSVMWPRTALRMLEEPGPSAALDQPAPKPEPAPLTPDAVRAIVREVVAEAAERGNREALYTLAVLLRRGTP